MRIIRNLLRLFGFIYTNRIQPAANHPAQINPVAQDAVNNNTLGNNEAQIGQNNNIPPRSQELLENITARFERLRSTGTQPYPCRRMRNEAEFIPNSTPDSQIIEEAAEKENSDDENLSYKNLSSKNSYSEIEDDSISSISISITSSVSLEKKSSSRSSSFSSTQYR